MMSFAARCSGPYSATMNFMFGNMLASIVNVFCQADGWPW